MKEDTRSSVLKAAETAVQELLNRSQQRNEEFDDASINTKVMRIARQQSIDPIEATGRLLHLARPFAPPQSFHVDASNLARLAVTPEHHPFGSNIAASSLINSFLSQVLSSHPALHHRYLKRLRSNQFPNTPLAIFDFASNHAVHSSFFRENVASLASRLSNPRHRQLLQDDLREEDGHLSPCAIKALESMQLTPHSVENVSHHILFRRFLSAVQCVLEQDGYSHFLKQQDVQPSQIFANTVRSVIRDTGDDFEARAVGALSIGGEAVVRPIYSAIFESIKTVLPTLSPEDYVYFPLHIVGDDAHASTLLDVASDIATRSNSAVSQIITGAYIALDARAKLWSALEARADVMQPIVVSPAATISNGCSDVPHYSVDMLYDQQASNWVRHHPRCLSDFTGRPPVLSLLNPPIGSSILDIGCGEGYLARTLRTQFQVSSVLGIDVSSQMIAAALDEELQHPKGGLHYIHGDATHLVDSVQSSAPGTVPHVLYPSDVFGAFDSAVACFVFNYMTVSDMIKTLKDVRLLLKPGGSFVFSVPHPCLPFWEFGNQRNERPFSFDRPNDGYFINDAVNEGTIATIDGTVLKVRNLHKTFQTYFSALREAGFSETPIIEELGVTDALLQKDPTFFGAMYGAPLHVAFKTRRPVDDQVEVMSPEIFWDAEISRKDIEMTLPNDAADELGNVANMLINKGMTPDDLSARDIPISLLDSSKKFARMIRNKLWGSGGMGAVLLTSLFKDDGSCVDLDDKVLRMVYFLLCNLIGSVDRSRGALWDVKDTGQSTAEDGVLFSETNEYASFHTDGSRREFFPDIVGLLCIRPASYPHGQLKLANACNVRHRLQEKIPEDLFHQLHVPVIRDRIKGGNKKSHDKTLSLTAKNFCTHVLEAIERDEEVRRRVIIDNAFEIFKCDSKGTRVRTRYMRDWIHSGHAAAGLDVDTQLTEALDRLDQELVAGPLLSCWLKRGNVIFLNNHIIMHSREAFPKKSSRLMVRAWIDIHNQEV